MKKYLLFLGIIGLFALTACGKQAKISDVTIDYGSSSIYSKEDMDAAIKAIETVDACVGRAVEAIREVDGVMFICADHGNDPVHAGWNHTREYVPLLVYGEMVRENTDLGILRSFADVGASICEYLGVPKMKNGTSFLSRIRK